MKDYNNISRVEGRVRERLDPGAHYYLLLDSWRLQAYVNKGSRSKTAKEMISELDPFTAQYYVWKDTLLDKHANQGPLLVEIEADSPLIDCYLTQWASVELGLLITSPEPLTVVLDHFKSLIAVNLPDGKQARLRFHDPKKVTAAFAALTETRCSLLMGPLKQVIWRETCESGCRWLLSENPKPDYTSNRKPRWFQFTEGEMSIINQLNRHFLVNTLVTEISEIIEDKKSRSETQGIEYLLNSSVTDIKALIARGISTGTQIQISNANDIRRYIKLALFNEPLLKRREIKSVLLDITLPADKRLQTIEGQLHLLQNIAV